MDRPILFSAPMVRALLDGRKTQTRRVLKPQPTCSAVQSFEDDDGIMRWVPDPIDRPSDEVPLPVRFAVGDRLWVRETWAHVPLKGGAMGAIYRADGESAEDDIEEGWDFLGKWRVSIHMPRKFSRLTLAVTDVRVQRLQEIGEGDAKAEGVIEYEPDELDPAEFAPCEGGYIYNNAVSAYGDLWNRINGAGAWDANPWVVALTFTVERRNIDAPADTMTRPRAARG